VEPPAGAGGEFTLQAANNNAAAESSATGYRFVFMGVSPESLFAGQRFENFGAG
jgi:hypothetical protein